MHGLLAVRSIAVSLAIALLVSMGGVSTASAAGTFTAPVPTVKGTMKVGYKLTATPGTWKPAASTLKFQWLRSGTVIQGATATSYTLAGADLAKTITVKVTGTRAGYTAASMTSKPGIKVVAGTLTAPVPTINGTVASGSKLTAVPGTWTTGTTLSYQWLRAGVAITGATTSTYTLTSSDISKTLSVRVTGVKTGYTTISKTSAATTAVTAGTLTAPVPTITGQPTVNSKLTAVPGTWTTGTTLSYQWLRNDVVISGATSSTYTLVADDFSKTIAVRVTGVKSGYTTASKTSASTGPVTQIGITVAPAVISTDTIWNSGIYLINENLTVSKGATLTIQAGVSVKAIDYSWVSLIVDGALVVNGTAAAPVVFTSLLDDTAGGDGHGGALGDGESVVVVAEAQRQPAQGDGRVSGECSA